MRAILQKVESDDLEEFDAGWVWTRGSDFFVESDNYQIDLLCQAGFLETHGRETIGSTVSDRLRVTNEGHNFLDAIRDEGIWERTKAAVADTGGNATLEIVKAIGVGFLKKQISNHTGLEL